MASFEKMANGTWSVRFRDKQGKNKRLSGYRTKKEADSAYAEFINKIDNNPSAIGTAKFDDVFKAYAEFQVSRTKESSTYNRNKLYETNIKDFFGSRTLSSITPLLIKNFQEKLNDKNLSYAYKRKILGLVSSTFKYAIAYYDFPTNPIEKAAKIRRVNEPKKEKQVWDIDDFNQFIKCVPDEPYKTLFLFLYETGCRKGEILALYWSDIDLANGTVSINKTYTRKTDTAPYKISNTPKTESSNRTIKMPSALVNALTELKKDSTGKFVFGGDKPIHENTLRYKLKAAIAKANESERKIPDISFHEFRHSHASLLISRGISIVTVSKRLGHSSIQETLDTYSHLMPNDDNKAVDILDSLEPNLGTELGTKK